MKTKHLWLSAIALCSIMCMAFTSKEMSGNQAPKASQLEVSFMYEKQSGPGSNQYAVWIENEKGVVVKTLFVTSFTSKGRARGNAPAVRGYVTRPACVPTWVKSSKVADLTDAEVDAFTGATPQANGKQTFTWNFTDQNGKRVPQGKYRVKVEATLYNNSTILYTGSFSTSDKTGDISLSSSLTEVDEQHKNMVTNVKAALK